MNQVEIMNRMVCMALCLLFLVMGGLHGQSRRNYLECLVTTSCPDGHYRVGDTAKVYVQAYAGGVPLDGVTVHYACGDDMYPADYADSVVFRKGMAVLPVGTRMVPGFRFCEFHFAGEAGSKRDFLKVAFAPDSIRPTVQMPTDFQAFWKDRIRRMRDGVPAPPVVKPMPRYSTADVEVSLVKLVYGDKAVYGYLCRPRAEGRYPVVLNPPGAGMGRLEPDLSFAESGFISFTMEIHGLSPLASEDERRKRWKELGDYWYAGLDSREHYYYHDVFLGCVRAMDYLCSLPEYDGRHAGVYGGSQGGALSIVTAALCPQVNFVVAFYPAMCDMGGFYHGCTGGWPKFFQKDKERLPTDVEAMLNTLPYYDIVNFARLLRVPGFYSWGYKDNTCPPTSIWAAVNCIRAPKTIVIVPSSAHWSFPETRRKAMEWMIEQVK